MKTQLSQRQKDMLEKKYVNYKTEETVKTPRVLATTNCMDCISAVWTLT